MDGVKSSLRNSADIDSEEVMKFSGKELFPCAGRELLWMEFVCAIIKSVCV